VGAGAGALAQPAPKAASAERRIDVLFMVGFERVTIGTVPGALPIIEEKRLRTIVLPWILIETAFISNPKEEARLGDREYLTQLIHAPPTGVQRYFARNPPLARNRVLQVPERRARLTRAACPAK